MCAYNKQRGYSNFVIPVCRERPSDLRERSSKGRMTLTLSSLRSVSLPLHGEENVFTMDLHCVYGKAEVVFDKNRRKE